ncbi:hypothetical protein ElyMa_000184200, partial [Elysia marginata]
VTGPLRATCHLTCSKRMNLHFQEVIIPSMSTQPQAVEVHAQPLLTPRPGAARKRKYPQERYTANPVNDKMLDTISRIGTKLAQKEVLDEDEYFCRSLISKIKSLDPFSKLECQAEIQMVILRYMRRSVQAAEGRQSQTYRSRQGSDYDQYHYQTFDLSQSVMNVTN